MERNEYFKKMKMVFVLSMALMIWAGSLSAQTSPPWTPISGNQYNMIALGNVYRNGVLLPSNNYWVGTCGPGGLATDCRSVSQVASNGSYYATIRGDVNGQTIQFFIWEGSTGQTYQAAETLSFLSDDTRTGFDLHYTVTIPTYTISGQVTLNGSGLANVTIGGLPGNPVTNAQGNYTATVNQGWSGTATPALTGYTFSPINRPYTNVTANQSSQNYTATQNPVPTYTISGQVTLNGSGLANVTIGGLPGNPMTNAQGNYTATVNQGWSGTATPALAGYTFTPANRSYNNVTANQSSQNYTAAQTPVPTYTISGRVTLNGSGLVGVAIGGLPGNPVTNAQGNYTTTVNQGWSGTATPALAGYTFAPGIRSYTNVVSNQVNQDYTATAVGPQSYTISGMVTLSGNPLPGVTISGLIGDPVTDGGGRYSVVVPSGWSGTAMPRLVGHMFTPPAVTYVNVTANQQTNYTAERHSLHIIFNAGSGGRVTGVLDQTVPYGGQTSPVSAAADTGYRFSGWSGNEGFSSQDNPLVISNVVLDMTVTANFIESDERSGIHIINPRNDDVVYGIFFVAAEVDANVVVTRVEFQVSQIAAASAPMQVLDAEGGLSGRPAFSGTPAENAAKSMEAQKIEMGNNGTRYLYEWNTRQCQGGWYLVRAVGFKPDGKRIVDEVRVRVENIFISLQVERRQDQGLRVKRQYAVVHFEVNNLGGLLVSHYLVWRRQNNGAFTLVREVRENEMSGFRFHFEDCYLEEDSRYGYRVAALDSSGAIIGQSFVTEI